MRRIIKNGWNSEISVFILNFSGLWCEVHDHGTLPFPQEAMIMWVHVVCVVVVLVALQSQGECCKIFNISCTKSINLNDSHFVLQLSLPNPLKPDVKWRMKMYLEQRGQVMLQLHLIVNKFIAYWGVTCIRDLTVCHNGERPICFISLVQNQIW